MTKRNIAYIATTATTFTTSVCTASLATAGTPSSSASAHVGSFDLHRMPRGQRVHDGLFCPRTEQRWYLRHELQPHVQSLALAISSLILSGKLISATMPAPDLFCFHTTLGFRRARHVNMQRFIRKTRCERPGAVVAARGREESSRENLQVGKKR